MSQYSQNCKDLVDEGKLVCMPIFNRCLCGIKFRSKSKYPHDLWLFGFIVSVETTKKKGNTQSNAGKAEPVKPAGSIRHRVNPNQLLQEESKIPLVSTVK